MNDYPSHVHYLENETMIDIDSFFRYGEDAKVLTRKIFDIQQDLKLYGNEQYAHDALDNICYDKMPKNVVSFDNLRKDLILGNNDEESVKVYTSVYNMNRDKVLYFIKSCNEIDRVLPCIKSEKKLCDADIGFAILDYPDNARVCKC